jgi:transposase
LNGMICQNELGKMTMRYKDSENGWIDYVLEPKKAIKLHYNSKTEEYSLYEPYEVVTEMIEDREKYVGSDPGIRVPFTCLSATEVIEFGEKLVEEIKELLTKIDKNNEKKKEGEKESPKNKKIYRRLKNIVDEAHWKIAKYLTDNYDEIYLGKINMQSIVKNDNLTDMTKRVGTMLRHYEFRQRLKFKCEEKRVYYKEVDERYTSKTCSVCGGYKEDLGGNEIYECGECGTVIGRDIGACRCILIKNTNNKKNEELEQEKGDDEDEEEEQENNQ